MECWICNRIILDLEVKIMDKQKIRSIENTISMLMRLDENSLILIENNAETLKKYLDLKKEREKREGRS